MDSRRYLQFEAFSGSFGYFKTNKRIASMFGPTKTAFIINLIDNHIRLLSLNKIKEDDWFFVTYDTQKRQIGVKDKNTLRRCKQFFIKLGVLETKTQGLPAKEYYRIDFDVLEGLLVEGKFEITRGEESHSMEVANSSPIESGKTGSHSNNRYNKKRSNKLSKDSSVPPATAGVSDGMKKRVLKKVRNGKSRTRKRKVNHRINNQTKETSAIIEYWGKQTLLKRKLKLTDPPTKIYRKTTQVLSQMMTGTLSKYIPKSAVSSNYEWFSKKWTMIEIKQAISNMNEMCQPGNAPLKKDWLFKMALANAIYNPRTGTSVLMKAFHEGAQPLVDVLENFSVSQVGAYANLLQYFKARISVNMRTKKQIKELVENLSGLRESVSHEWTNSGNVESLVNHYLSFLRKESGWSTKFEAQDNLSPMGLKYQGFVWNQFVEACFDNFDEHPVTRETRQQFKNEKKRSSVRSNKIKKSPEQIKKEMKAERRKANKEARLKEKRRIERLIEEGKI